MSCRSAVLGCLGPFDKQVQGGARVADDRPEIARLTAQVGGPVSEVSRLTLVRLVAESEVSHHEDGPQFGYQLLTCVIGVSEPPVADPVEPCRPPVQCTCSCATVE